MSKNHLNEKLISLKEKFSNVADPPFKLDLKRIDVFEHEFSKKIENIQLNRLISIPEKISSNYCNKLNRILQSKSKDYPSLRKQLLSDLNNNKDINNPFIPTPDFLKFSFLEPLPQSNKVVLPSLSKRTNITDKKRSENLNIMKINEISEASVNNDLRNNDINNTIETTEINNIYTNSNENISEYYIPNHNRNFSQELNYFTDRSNKNELFEFDRKRIFDKIKSKKKLIANKENPNSKTLITSGYTRPSINSVMDLPRKHVSLSNVNESKEQSFSNNNIQKIQNIKKVIKKTQIINNINSNNTKNFLFYDFRRRFSKSNKNSFDLEIARKIEQAVPHEEERSKMLQGIRLQIAQLMKKKTRLIMSDFANLQDIVKNLNVENKD